MAEQVFKLLAAPLYCVNSFFLIHFLGFLHFLIVTNRNREKETISPAQFFGLLSWTLTWQHEFLVIS